MNIDYWIKVNSRDAIACQLGPGTRDCQTWRRHRLIASSPAARCSACARNWGARLQSVTAGRSLPCSCSEFGRARLQPAVVEVGATGLGAGRAGEGGAAAARRSTMSSTHRFAASSSLPHRWAWPTFATLRPPVANGSWIGSRGMRRGSASGQGRIDYGVTLTHAWEESWAVLLSWTISNWSSYVRTRTYQKFAVRPEYVFDAYMRRISIVTDLRL
jgi:hypothetical protein